MSTIEGFCLNTPIQALQKYNETYKLGMIKQIIYLYNYYKEHEMQTELAKLKEYLNKIISFNRIRERGRYDTRSYCYGDNYRIFITHVRVEENARKAILHEYRSILAKQTEFGKSLIAKSKEKNTDGTTDPDGGGTTV